jgi:chaperonin GroES
MIAKPLGKRVLVAENKAETKTASGIILEGADSTRESKTATVLAVGPEVTLVNVGDVVLIDWGKSQIVVLEGAQRVILTEEHVVAVIEK